MQHNNGECQVNAIPTAQSLGVCHIDLNYSTASHSLATTKTKAQNELRVASSVALRVSLSPIPPRLDLIRSQRQALVSH